MRILYVFLGIKNKFILLNVILFVNILSVKAQSNQLPGQIEIIESFNGFQYHLVNQVWKVKNPNTNQFYVVTTDKISVKYKSSATSAQIVNVENALNLTRTEKLKIGWYHYEIALNQESIIDFARNLSLNTLILAVDIPSYHQPTGQLSNDPVSTSSWYFDKINMYDAWEIETGLGSPIIVSVLDDGIDWSHEDLGMGSDGYQNIFLNDGEDDWSNPNDPSTGDGIDNDGNGYIDDWKGYHFGEDTNNTKMNAVHGTRVSGVISAKTHNMKGISGVAGGWNGSGCKLLLCGISFTQAIAEAIEYSIDMNARIINMSFSYGPSLELQDAIEDAYHNNVIIIAAAGNSNSPVLSYPAVHPLVIGVGGTTYNDEKHSASSYGSGLDLAAPASAIWTTEDPNSYHQYDRTSFSAPLVSGMAALMLTQNPCLGAREIKDILTSTADKVGGYYYDFIPTIPGKSQMLGYGRVNAHKAVEVASLSINPGVDLYMRDRFNDVGSNAGYQFTWDFDESPDIWVRNNPDGFILENQFHEALSFEFNPQDSFYVYVRVGNRGCTPSLGSEVLRLYRSIAATNSSWPGNWDGTDQNGYGAIIGTQIIPTLSPGESIVIEFPWAPHQNVGHCLMARIENSVEDPITVHVGDAAQDVYQNNNIAMRNVFIHDIYPNIKQPIINGIQYPFGDFVTVGNVRDEAFNHDIIFCKPSGEPGKSLTDEAEVTLLFDDLGWNLFYPNFMDRSDIKIIGENKIQLLSDSVMFNNIPFASNQRISIYFGYSFLSKELTEKNTFGYRVIQKYSNDDPIIGEHWTGSVHYYITKYARNPFEADAGDDILIKQGESTTLNAKTIQEDAEYNWYDKDGNLIYSGNSFSATPEITQKYKLEIIANIDGVKDYDEIEVKVNPFYIKSLSPNPTSTNLKIEYQITVASSAYLSIVNSQNPLGFNNFILDCTSSVLTIDLSDFSSGIYTVVLICDGEVKDAKQLVIE